MLKFMLNTNTFYAIEECLLRISPLAGIAIFATRNHIVRNVSHRVINSIQSAVYKRFARFSNIAEVAWRRVTIKTRFLAQLVKQFFRYIPNITSINTSTLNIVISDNKVSPIPTFFKSITYQSFAPTTARFSFFFCEHALFNAGNIAANTYAFPISSCSVAVFPGNRTTFNRSQKVKFFSRQINFFHSLPQLDILYHKNEVHWHA